MRMRILQTLINFKVILIYDKDLPEVYFNKLLNLLIELYKYSFIVNNFSFIILIFLKNLMQ